MSDIEEDFVIVGHSPSLISHTGTSSSNNKNGSKKGDNNNNNNGNKGSNQRPFSESINMMDYDPDQDELVDVTDEICGPSPVPLSKDTALFKLEQYTYDSDDECDEELITTTKRTPRSNDALFDDFDVKPSNDPRKSLIQKAIAPPTPPPAPASSSSSSSSFSFSSSPSSSSSSSSTTTTATAAVTSSSSTTKNTSTGTSLSYKPSKRHGLVALFKKNAGMSEEEYEGATLNALAREQREYFEKCSTLWDAMRPCDLVTTGNVTLTLYFPESKTPHPIRIDLRSTSTEVLYQAIKEYCKDFGKKVKSLDPRHFDFSLKSLSSETTKEYLMSCAAGENPYLPLLPGAPMWLYSLCSKDVLILSRKTGDRAAAALSETFREAEFVDELYVIVKVVLVEYNASTTIKLPRFVMAKTLMNVINSYKWAQAGVHYRVIDSKNFRYYGLYYLSQDEKWMYLDPEQPLATYPLPNLVHLYLYLYSYL